MTYAAFHLFFLCPALVVAFLLSRNERKHLGKHGRLSIMILCFFAVSYTTPWDNYLIYKKVWWYGEDRVLGTLFYVPIEEYIFFFLQTILMSWFFLWVAKPSTWSRRGSVPSILNFTSLVCFLPCLMCVPFLFNDQTLYLGLITTWSLFVLGLQWIIGGRRLWALRKPILLTVGVGSLYLGIADGIAINQGIWTISPQYTIGVSLLGLPFEEALFFVVTNFLVVQGITLFCDPDLRYWVDQRLNQ